MKKILFVSALFVSLFQFSCSSDDENETQENTSPNEAVLTIAQESGLSVDLTWDEVIDPDGDTVTYDLFANGEIIEADLAVVDYMWTAEGREGIVYPIVFTVVSKDGNGGESISNEVELDDPIIGEWNLVLLADILDDEGTLSDFMNANEVGLCNDEVNSLVFTNDNDFSQSFQDRENGICFTANNEGTWNNIENQNYSFVLTDENGEESTVEMFFVFDGNTLGFTTSDSSFIYERQ